MKTFGILCAAAAVLSFGAVDGRCGEISVAPTLVDFGPVSVSGGPAFQGVVISNTGTTTLVNGLSPSGFSCNSFGSSGPPFPIQLASGQNIFVTVTFDPSSRGALGCNVTVQDNDANQDSYQLTGVGTAPFLFLTSPPYPAPLHFADQGWDGGVPETLHVEIQNTGNEAIQASNFTAGLSQGTNFTVGVPVFPVPPGATARIPVIFDPTSEGAKSDVLLVALNNDLPSDPNVLVTVDGWGTNPVGVDLLADGRGFLRLLGPNPVTDRARFAFAIPTEGRVKIGLFDTAGRLVAPLHDATEAPGRHLWEWSRSASKATPPGVYLVRLTFDGSTLGASRVVVLQ